MVNEEQRLVQAAQGGDVESFNQLVRLYESRVYTLCYRMLGDADGAADVTQETFISAYRNLAQFRGGQFRSWLLRIATNNCYDLLRARKRRPVTSLQALGSADDEGVGFDIPDQSESPDAVALRHELAAAIQHALVLLPEDQRVVIILSDIQGMSYEEIATVTQSNVGTVKSRLSRGRSRVRDILRAGELLPMKFRHEGG